MKRIMLASIVFLLAISNCFSNEKTIERLIMDYPHGEARVQISSNNDAYLLYASIVAQKNTVGIST